MSLLVFLFFQKVEDARALLQAIDPKLGKPLPERSYAEHCALYTPDDPVSRFRNIMDTINDEFIIAHLLGWFGKALLLRDAYLCWIMSILFEILEISMQHILPNFAECWWDHIILDILVCNFLGFTLGLKVSSYFRMKSFNWISTNVKPSVDEYNWEVLKSWKRMVAAVLLVVFVTVIELNAFFLKYVLWIPPPHPVNVCRLFIWWSIGLPGVREFYQFVTDPNCKKFGPMVWICCAITSMEILVCFKFGQGMFPKPHPPIIIYSWLAFAACFFLWGVWFFWV